jgi:dipeptidyl aminopeptidase/acylaminoacyl peptidase
VSDDELVTRRPVAIPSGDELIDAIVYERHGAAAPRPVVVISPARLRNIESLEWLSRALAARGYVVVAQRFREGAVRYQLRDVEDVSATITFAAGLAGVDSSRIGVIGHSRGGSASLRATAVDARIRSTVALSPPIDIARYVRTLREYAPTRYELMVTGYGGTPDDNPDYYRAIAPLTYADRIRTPVLLIHGLADMVAPPEHSRWMHEALCKSGNLRTRLEVLPGLGHFFEEGGGGYRVEKVVELTLDWFDETLSERYEGTMKQADRDEPRRPNRTGR